MVDKNEDLVALMVDKRQVADPVAHAEWAAKKLCWIPDEEQGFVAASIVKEEGDKIVCKYDSGKQATFHKDDIPVSYTHLTLPTIYSV